MKTVEKTNNVKLDLQYGDAVNVNLPGSLEDIAKFMKLENVNYTVENN